VLVALFEARQWTVAAVAGATAVLTLVMFIRVQQKALFGPLPARLAAMRDVPASMSGPVLALGFLCLITFALWPLGLGAIIDAAAGAVHAGADAVPAVENYLRLVLGRP
jgi:formate hydrogenlyase subunit 3/multisubunit Na+/H+ antiporter MnhD subunit